jgi:SAM-dependent methyltransferase
MEKDEYQKHYELEENFWWFAGKRSIIKTVLESLFPKEKRPRLLDIGCGTGYNLKFFQTNFDAFGCDISSHALHFARKRNFDKIVQADAGGLPFKDSSFDLVSLLDVLYHKRIENDLAVLNEVHRVLNGEGHVLITDSAFQFLQSQHDLALHTRERYTQKSLRMRLEAADFNIEKISYFNFFLFVFIVLVRLIQRIDIRKNETPKSNLKPLNPRLNDWLLSVMKLEASIIKYIRFPFGSSVVCLAKRSMT